MTMTTASLLARAHDGVVDEPVPAARPRRRSFSAEYKEQILAEYDELAAGSSERGALLRREGLYSSHIAEWHKARDAGVRDGLAPKPTARRSAEQVELERLRRKTERLEAELERTKTRWRSREKCMRSWSSSPRARRPRRSRSRDRRASRRPRSGDVDQAGVRAAGRVAGDGLPAAAPSGVSVTGAPARR